LLGFGLRLSANDEETVELRHKGSRIKDIDQFRLRVTGRHELATWSKLDANICWQAI